MSVDETKYIVLQNQTTGKKLNGVVRIRPDAELIVRRLQLESGQTAAELVSSLIVQVYEKGLVKIQG